MIANDHEQTQRQVLEMADTVTREGKMGGSPFGGRHGHLFFMLLVAFVMLAVLLLCSFGDAGAVYGVDLEREAGGGRIEVNPVDETEVEFFFTLRNSGNENDTYTIEVETQLGSGTYKDWIMEFENKTGVRKSTLTIPGDMKGSESNVLEANESVRLSLYVIVAWDEEEDIYNGISISAMSDGDNSQVEYVYFNLTVILPNIRVSDDPDDFYISPSSGIKEGDDVDISIRIFNYGSAETGEFYVFFYNGKRESPNEIPGNYISFEKIDTIAPGQFVEILTTWDEIPGGENDLYVYADKPIRSGDGKTLIDNKFSSDGMVMENRENDNTATIDDQFQLALDLRPDLVITRVFIEDNLGGTTTHVWVTVANAGSANAEQGSAIVSLKIGGTSLKGERSNRFNPEIPEEIFIGDEIHMEFWWEVPNEDRTFTVKASVDHPDDSNSNNDRITEYITVIRDDGDDEQSPIEAQQVILLIMVIGFVFVFIFPLIHSKDGM